MGASNRPLDAGSRIYIGRYIHTYVYILYIYTRPTQFKGAHFVIEFILKKVGLVVTFQWSF